MLIFTLKYPWTLSFDQLGFRGATLRVRFPTLYTLRVPLKASVPKVYGAANGLVGRAPTIPRVQGKEEPDAETYWYGVNTKGAPSR